MKEIYKNIIDISPVISTSTPVFPGDVPYSRKEMLSFEKGHHLTLSSINTTVHVGAHADAPIHYHKNGKGIDQRNLDYYFGYCQVIDLSYQQIKIVKREHLLSKKISSKRVLFKTNSFPARGPWQDQFISLHYDLIQYLSDLGVMTIGIDTPSIDDAKSKSLNAHQMIYNANMAILEGLDLTSVKEGQYLLSALPLKLEDADASPVRAVLFELN